jgi:tetratricopeptide (TPR) repeat protein
MRFSVDTMGNCRKKWAQVRKRNVLAALIPLLAVFVAAGRAQDPQSQSTVQGTVRDSRGGPVAGATAHLLSLGTAGDVTLRTDAKGAYRYVALAAGEYTIRVEKAGYRDANFGPFALREGQSTTIELTLTAATEKVQGAAMTAPQFFDPPQFTVAGVTDATNHGGHGSDAVSRTTQSLAHDVKTLDSQHAAAEPAGDTQASLREALQRDPGDFDTNRRLGTMLASAGKPAEALPFLERAHQIRRDDYDSARKLAKAYAALGRYPDARVTTDALLAQRDTADLHHLLAELEEKQQRPLQAVHEYQRAAELDPSETNLFDWGTELLTHRTLQPAIEVFTRGHRLFPQASRMLIGLGVAWYAGGSSDQAANYVCQASDLNPADPNPYLVLGKMGAAETAGSPAVLERLARFAQLQPASAQANYYYAVALWQRNRTSKSTETSRQVEALLEKARQLDPKLAAASLQLGILYEERRDSARAIEKYQEAIATDPQLREAHYRLAQIYRRSGEKLKAEQELAAYNRISREVTEQNEREAHEIPQFVYTLRDSKSPASPQ